MFTLLRIPFKIDRKVDIKYNMAALDTKDY